MKAQQLLRKCLVPFLAMSMFAASTHADVVVIVSAKSAITRLTTEQVTKIFLGKTASFPNGGDAVPLDQAEGNATRNEFYAKVVNKSPAQMSAYWTKIIFTGDGYPPKQVEGNLSVRNAVAGNQNAIGYIDRSAVDGSVRVILAP